MFPRGSPHLISQGPPYRPSRVGAPAGPAGPPPVPSTFAPSFPLEDLAGFLWFHPLWPYKQGPGLPPPGLGEGDGLARLCSGEAHKGLTFQGVDRVPWLAPPAAMLVHVPPWDGPWGAQTFVSKMKMGPCVFAPCSVVWCPPCPDPGSREARGIIRAGWQSPGS